MLRPPSWRGVLDGCSIGWPQAATDAPPKPLVQNAASSYCPSHSWEHHRWLFTLFSRALHPFLYRLLFSCLIGYGG